MNRPIVRDIAFLKKKSTLATVADIPIADDLLDTLKANEAGCVGLAANMIGESKCIIAVHVGFFNRILINPVIVAKSGAYRTKEGCLSLVGVRPVTRYQTIEVEFETKNFERKREQFTGFTAQIVQHEIDHCNGIII